MISREARQFKARRTAAEILNAVVEPCGSPG
jgi:hypothetical protein